MKFSDIIALAKQGYKPSDIRELFELAEDVKEETTSEGSADGPTEPEPEPASEPAPETPAAAAQSAGPEVDMQDEKIKTLETKIAQLQENNTRRPRPEETPKKTDAEILEDMARRFM